MSFTGYGHGRRGSRGTRTASKLGGITPIDGQRLEELLGSQPNTTTKEEDMHPGLIWSRQEMVREEGERLARIPPEPSAEEVLARLYLAGVRPETAAAVVEEALVFLAARLGATSRDAVALGAEFQNRIEHRYDGTWQALAFAGRGVEDLRRLLVAMLAAEGR